MQQDSELSEIKFVIPLMKWPMRQLQFGFLVIVCLLAIAESHIYVRSLPEKNGWKKKRKKKQLARIKTAVLHALTVLRFWKLSNRILVNSWIKDYRTC